MSLQTFLEWFTQGAIVLLAIRWSSHSFGDVKVFCEKYGKPLEQGRNLGSSLFEAFVPRPLRECFERFARDRIGEELGVQTATHQLRRLHRPAQSIELAAIDDGRGRWLSAAGWACSISLSRLRRAGAEQVKS